MPAGRPTVYKEEYCQQMIEFFDIEPYKEVTETFYYKDWSSKDSIKLIPNKLPTFSKFARTIGVNRATLLDRATKTDESWHLVFPEFSSTYEVCKDIMKDYLNDNGLMNLYNSAYCKFVAINATDMKDKSEVDQNTNLTADDALTAFMSSIGK